MELPLFALRRALARLLRRRIRRPTRLTLAIPFFLAFLFVVVLPRPPTLVSLLSVRAAVSHNSALPQTAQGRLPSSSTQSPALHLVVIVSDLPQSPQLPHPALRALAAQSLVPSSLLLVLLPSLSRRDRSKRLAAEAARIAFPKPPSPAFLTISRCPDHADDSAEAVDACVAHHLAKLAATLPANDFIAALPHNAVLEPAALEKLWLYLFSHSSLSAVRSLSYATHRNVSLPSASSPSFINTLPILFRPSLYHRSPSHSHTHTHPYFPIIQLLRNARLFREPLYTTIPTLLRSPLTLSPDLVPPHQLPPHLWNDHAFYKWSARQEYQNVYQNSLTSVAERNAFDFWGMPYRDVRNPVHPSKPRVFFLMPWMQMGGSENCFLDVARKFASMKYSVTFIFTMPFWAEDSLGEISLRHEWINKAYAITSDVFDIVHLAPSYKFSKILRYLIESRAPDYVLTGNARIVYEHAKFIHTLSPNTVIADYNHMVHMDWQVVPGKGGGMPRYGAEYTDHIAVHLTASQNVTNAMKSWIEPDMIRSHPKKVQTCHIGTNPDQFLTGDAKALKRAEMRRELSIPESAVVVLFAGRFVSDKGIDVMADVMKRVSEHSALSKKLVFVFVGSGEEDYLLKEAQQKLRSTNLLMMLQPPAQGIDELKDYYAMSDIFLLPSRNEGIALVLYEAMAAGMLAMSTDVGGQRELLRSDTAILLPNLHDSSALATFIVQQLEAVTKFGSMFKDIQMRGTKLVRTEFTTARFTKCVVDNMIHVKSGFGNRKVKIDEKEMGRLRGEMSEVMRGERIHGSWNRDQVKASIEGQVTVGIKTYVCDSSIVRQVLLLIRSIRVNYPYVRVILANDGPMSLNTEPLIRDDMYTEEIRLAADSGISIGRNMMVNMTTTKYFVLLDDDHVFDGDTDLRIAIDGISKSDFDVVGLRVRNLPGIEELERISIFIPRYVAKISKFENRELTLCVWNENNGPGVQKMRVPIRVDVLHNALIARTDVLRAHAWRNELKVNEHMSFFLDAKRAGVKVGYLPSVFVHHRARRYSQCYKSVRFREESYEKLLDYKDSYLWDAQCGDEFPVRVLEHIKDTNEGMR